MSRKTEYQMPWFNERLNRAMDDSGLSIEEIAQRTGIQRSTLYNWYNGVGWPSVPNIFKLEEVLGLERGDLIKK